MAKDKTYTGILLEPVYYEKLPFPILSNPSEADEIRATALRECFNERMAALFDFYDISSIDPDGYTKLAISLAHTHVPGFSIIIGEPPKKGRKLTWTEEKINKLLVEVNDYVKNGETEFAACRFLIKDKKYPEYTTVRALYTKYKSFVKRNNDDSKAFDLMLKQLFPV